MSAYINKIALAAALVALGGSVSPSQAAFCNASIISMGCFDTLQAGSIGQGSGQNGVMVFGSNVTATAAMVPDAPIHYNSPPNISAPYQVTSNSVPANYVEVTPILFSSMNTPPTIAGTIFGTFSTVASLVINGLNSLTGGFNQLVFSFLGQSGGNGNSGDNVTFIVAKGADTYNVSDIIGQSGNVFVQNNTPVTETFNFANFAAAQTLTIYALSNDRGFSQAHFGNISAAPAPIPGAGFLSFLALGFAKLRRRGRALWRSLKLAAPTTAPGLT